MKAIIRVGLTVFFAALTTLLAQNPAAPIPSPILNARKVFVGNAGTDLGAQANGMFFAQDLGARAYESFYQGLKAWGHYQLVDDPAEADLIYEIGVRSQGDGGEHNLSGNSLCFDVTILDRKTHTSLWRFVEGFDYAGLREAKRDQNFDRHMDHLLGLVKNLAEGTKP